MISSVIEYSKIAVGKNGFSDINAAGNGIMAINIKYRIFNQSSVLSNIFTKLNIRLCATQKTPTTKKLKAKVIK